MIDFFVFDTNSLISAAILPKSVNGRAFFKVMDMGLLGVSAETLNELESVLFRKKFDKYLTDNSERLAFLDRVAKSSLIFQPKLSVTACRDPKDNKFLELALAAKASCIITGDEDLLVLNPFRQIPILNASDFLVQF